MAFDFSLSGPNYPDDELSFLNAEKLARVKKMRGLLAKNPTCYVAMLDEFTVNKKSIMTNELTCIADMTQNAGPMNEVNGCALTVYSMDRGTYTPYGRPLPIVDKNCADGGFEKLMAFKNFFSAIGLNHPVSELVFSPQMGISTKEWNTVLVYVRENKYVDWFIKTRKDVRATKSK
jgi:hypothetical protein